MESEATVASISLAMAALKVIADWDRERERKATPVDVTGYPPLLRIPVGTGILQRSETN